MLKMHALAFFSEPILEKPEATFLQRCAVNHIEEITVEARAGELTRTGMPHLGYSNVHLVYAAEPTENSLPGFKYATQNPVYELFFLIPGRLQTLLSGHYLRFNPLEELAQVTRRAAAECAEAYTTMLEQNGIKLEFRVQPYVASSPINSISKKVGEPYLRRQQPTRKGNVIPFPSRR